ncbi:MAG: alginate lyase family protein [Planctomycetota bacterium]
MDEVLDTPPRTVTRKPLAPPSGDKRDYMTVGTYWWPNPDTSDGLPWVRRDGQRNPSTCGDDCDEPKLEALARDVETLVAAWHVTGDERYADHAARQLRVWFLDDETGMNPHMRYAQGVPGVSDGRKFGIIETHALLPMIDAVVLLRGSCSSTAGDDAALRAWFGQYVDWLVTSTFGRELAGAPNNMGTYLHAQRLWFGAYAEPRSVMADDVAAAFAQTMTQIEPDGRQPHELARTNALSYSLMNLRGIALLARLGEHVGLDLWHADPKLRAAFDYLLPTLLGETAWPHEQLGPLDVDMLRTPLQLAGLAWESPRLMRAASQLREETSRVTLLDLTM